MNRQKVSEKYVAQPLSFLVRS